MGTGDNYIYKRPPRRPPTPEVVELSGVYERPITTPPPTRPPFEGDIPMSSVFQRDTSKVGDEIWKLISILQYVKV